MSQPTVEVLRIVEEVRTFAEGTRASGQRLALVPTMGFLHEGHLTLMREGRRLADVVAASIFVNPTQFGPKEDLARYPRDLEGDLQKCASAGVKAVFVPDNETLYPKGYQTYVEVTEASLGLDGERRPGHFRGVATVVTKLFALFRPHVALFGEKDFQQLRVIEALARDLDLGVSVVGVPTVREADGLAMSSRNSYLSADERIRALALSKGLFAARDACAKGMRDAAELLALLRAELAKGDVREDYVALVDAKTLVPLGRVEPSQPARLMVAGFVGNTRLIDNIGL